MIRSITLQNFEAHEDTTVHFTDGLQLLVGKSNSGKSSLLRGLRMVVNNEWTKEMVRVGYEFCRVKVETDRGWVEAERGEKVNRWRCQENGGEIQTYQKVGISVPEQATRILGMGERDRGGGVKELPNFQSQMEKHYMLSEIGDKKASSNMIAVMMDNAIGLGGMENLIKDFSADLLKDRKWLNEKQSEIIDLKTGIIDKAIFKSWQETVDRIGDLHDDCEKMDAGLSTAEEMLDRHDEVKAKLDAARAKADSFPSVESLDDAVSECEAVIGMTGMLVRADAIRGMIADAQAVSSVDVGRIESVIREMESMNTEISGAESSLSDARNRWMRMDSAMKEEKILKANLSKADEEFAKMKEEMGVCPLCGNPLGKNDKTK